MTAIKYVSRREMQEKTGLRHALGYALPEEDQILILKGLSPEKKREVLAHEEDHIFRGEEGPFWGQVAMAAASVIGGAMSSRAAGRASDAATDAAAQQAAVARETRDIVRQDQQPFREAGYSALHQLLRLTGTPVPESVSQAGSGRRDIRPATASDGVDAVFRDYRGRPPTPFEREYYSERPHEIQRVINSGYYASEEASYADGRRQYEGGITTPEWVRQRERPARAAAPGGASTIEEMVKTDPSYEFRLNEGTRALERSAAARGGLLSGGTDRGITRYAQDYASTEYGKIYDRIANIAGLGQTGAANSAQGTVQGGALMSNAYGNAGFARASGYVAQGNAISNALNQGAFALGNAFGGRGSSLSQIDRTGFPQRVTGSIGGG